ncbi:hypothetical protein COBT_000352, partial [Conglomerata obtusa]
MYAYTRLFLPNDLKTLYIVNPKLEKSAAALSVFGGSFSDTVPGITHFLEHMLFTGTEKYPEDNDFAAFLSENNGLTNAGTYDDMTVFHFDVNCNKFEPALERFSWFFKKPIFDDSRLNREINAVDSEFNLIKNSNEWRLFRMMQYFSKTYNAFGPGNGETLQIDGIRDLVISHYKKNYTSKNMCLVIYHRDDSLKKKVQEFFGDILMQKATENLENFTVNRVKEIEDINEQQDENSKVDENENNQIDASNPCLCENELKIENMRFTKAYLDSFELSSDLNEVNYFKKFEFPFYIYDNHVFNDLYLNKYIYIESLTNIKKLKIHIEVPKKYLVYKNGSLDYLTYQFKAQDSNSLIYNLKQKELATDLDVVLEMNYQFSILIFDLNLTTKGLNKIEKVIKTFKTYLDCFYIDYNDYTEIKQIMYNKFKNVEEIQPMTLVKELARNLQYYPIEDVYDNKYKFKKYNAKELECILEILRDKKNWLVFVMNNNLKEIESFKDIYKSENNVKDSKNKFDILNNELGVINTEYYFEIKYAIGKEINTNNEIEEFSTYNNESSLKFLLNETYGGGHSYVSILLNTQIDKSDFIPVLFYLEMTTDSFKTNYYRELEKKMITVSTNLTSLGPEIIISGPTNNITTFAILFIRELKTLNFEMFDVIKEKIHNFYLAKKIEETFENILTLLNFKLTPNSVSIDEYIRNIEKMQPDDVKFLRICHVDLFVCGSGEDVIFKNLKKIVSKEFVAGEKFRYKNLTFDEYTVFGEDKGTNGVAIFIECGKQNDYKNLAKFEIIHQVSEERFFIKMRMEEELGYGILSTFYTVNDTNFLMFLVICEKDVEVINEKISMFVNDLNNFWESQSQENFDVYKEAALNNQNTKINNLEEYFQYMKKINITETDIKDHIEKIKNEIMNMNKDELVIKEHQIKIK